MISQSKSVTVKVEPGGSALPGQEGYCDNLYYVKGSTNSLSVAWRGPFTTLAIAEADAQAYLAACYIPGAGFDMFGTVDAGKRRWNKKANRWNFFIERSFRLTKAQATTDTEETYFPLPPTDITLWGYMDNRDQRAHVNGPGTATPAGFNPNVPMKQTEFYGPMHGFEYATLWEDYGQEFVLDPPTPKDPIPFPSAGILVSIPNQVLPDHVTLLGAEVRFHQVERYTRNVWQDFAQVRSAGLSGTSQQLQVLTRPPCITDNPLIVQELHDSWTYDIGGPIGYHSDTSSAAYRASVNNTASYRWEGSVGSQTSIDAVNPGIVYPRPSNPLGGLITAGPVLIKGGVSDSINLPEWLIGGMATAADFTANPATVPSAPGQAYGIADNSFRRVEVNVWARLCYQIGDSIDPGPFLPGFEPVQVAPQYVYSDWFIDDGAVIGKFFRICARVHGPFVNAWTETGLAVNADDQSAYTPKLDTADDPHAAADALNGCSPDGFFLVDTPDGRGNMIPAGTVGGGRTAAGYATLDYSAITPRDTDGIWKSDAKFSQCVGGNDGHGFTYLKVPTQGQVTSYFPVQTYAVYRTESGGVTVPRYYAGQAVDLGSFPEFSGFYLRCYVTERTQYTRSGMGTGPGIDHWRVFTTQSPGGTKFCYQTFDSDKSGNLAISGLQPFGLSCQVEAVWDKTQDAYPNGATWSNFPECYAHWKYGTLNYNNGIGSGDIPYQGCAVEGGNPAGMYTPDGGDNAPDNQFSPCNCTDGTTVTNSRYTAVASGYIDLWISNFANEPNPTDLNCSFNTSSNFEFQLSDGRTAFWNLGQQESTVKVTRGGEEVDVDYTIPGYGIFGYGIVEPGATGGFGDNIEYTEPFYIPGPYRRYINADGSPQKPNPESQTGIGPNKPFPKALDVEHDPNNPPIGAISFGSSIPNPDGTLNLDGLQIYFIFTDPPTCYYDSGPHAGP